MPILLTDIVSQIQADATKGSECFCVLQDDFRFIQKREVHACPTMPLPVVKKQRTDVVSPTVSFQVQEIRVETAKLDFELSFHFGQPDVVANMLSVKVGCCFSSTASTIGPP